VLGQNAKADAPVDPVAAAPFGNLQASDKDIKQHWAEQQNQKHHHLTDVEHMQISPVALLKDCASVS